MTKLIYLETAKHIFEFPMNESSDLFHWFHIQCGISIGHVRKLIDDLESQFWLTTLDTFKASVSFDESILQQLQIPKAIQLRIMRKITSMDFKKLEEVSVEDVGHMLQKIFPENPEYCVKFKYNLINGYSLQVVKNADELKSWGINSQVHAVVLFRLLTDWKYSGVSIKLFESCTSEILHVKCFYLFFQKNRTVHLCQYLYLC